jgi:ankyrin repeat protein
MCPPGADTRKQLQNSSSDQNRATNPLTLGPSPGGRGKLKTAPAPLPLPEGEGWGEGEKSVSAMNRGPIRNSALILQQSPRVCPYTTIPALRLRKREIKSAPMLSNKRSFKIAAGVLLALLLFHPFSVSSAGAATKSPNPKELGSGVLPLKTGDLYALVVGVSKYRDPKIPKLGLADKDAKAFGDFLKTQHAIFKETRVTSLLNEKATKSEVEKYLYYTLPKAGKEDTIILFFSGHGAFDPIRPKEFLFLPYDTETEYLSTSGVKMSGLDFLKGVSAERVLIVSDACYAGGFSGMKPKSVTPSVDLFLQEFRNSSGRAIISSSKDEQISWEVPQLKNSVFTHYLLEGLKGKADKDHDGVVTLNEAYEYAYGRTKDQTKGRQHPQIEGKMVGAFPLSFVGLRLPPSELRKKTLEAAASGDLTHIEQYLASGADVNLRDENNDTPLIVSSRNGHAEIVQLLISKGADVKATNNARSTALSAASEGGHAKVVKLLLAAGGADVNAKNAQGWTALALACAGGHADVVELLLRGKADVKARTNTGDTALTLACSEGHAAIAKRLLARWADINSRDLGGGTPVIRASRSGHGDIAKFLLSKGASVAPKGGGYLEHQLIIAVLKGDAKRAAFLLGQGANAESSVDSGDTALTLAAALGNAEVVKALSAKGANLESRASREQTALMAAAKNGAVEVVKLLIAAGAHVNATDQEGDTALILAARRGRVDVVKLLLSKEAAINSTDNEGSTALIAAVRNNRTDVAKVLSAAGADVNVKDKEGNSALIVASASGDADMVKLLTGKEADVNAANNRGSTALILATRNGHKGVVKVLLSKGADTMAQDWEGKSALNLASERGRPDLVELMKVH